MGSLGLGTWPRACGEGLRPLQQSRGSNHLVAEVWVEVLPSPYLLSPASLILSASSALVSHQRRLLKSGWILPGEARMAEGDGYLWAGKVWV